MLVELFFCKFVILLFVLFCLCLIIYLGWIVFDVVCLKKSFRRVLRIVAGEIEFLVVLLIEWCVVW